jgi:hypothetical protein
MIEPEMAFADLEDDMQLAEEFLKFLIERAWLLSGGPRANERIDDSVLDPRARRER